MKWNASREVTHPSICGAHKHSWMFLKGTLKQTLRQRRGKKSMLTYKDKDGPRQLRLVLKIDRRRPRSLFRSLVPSVPHSLSEMARGGFISLTEWRMCGQVLVWCSCPFSKSAFTFVTWPTHGHPWQMSPLHNVETPTPTTHTHRHKSQIQIRPLLKPMTWWQANPNGPPKKPQSGWTTAVLQRRGKSSR